jgi:hypothetical protein
MTARDELVAVIKNVRHTESYATDEDYADDALAWALSKVGENMKCECPVFDGKPWCECGAEFFNRRGEEIRGRLTKGG